MERAKMDTLLWLLALYENALSICGLGSAFIILVKQDEKMADATVTSFRVDLQSKTMDD